MIRSLLAFLFVFVAFSNYAQDDLEDLLGSDEDMAALPVSATFKTTRIINAHNVQMVAKKHCDMRVGHRFGDMSNGYSDLFGLDASTDIRVGFEFGITDHINVAFARNKGAIYDFYVKWKVLEQTVNDKMPISFVLLSSQVLKGGPASEDITSTRYFTEFEHRVSYVNQILIARKFNDYLSLQVMPTHIHRNLVADADESSLYALGVGGRVKLTKRFALIGDYYFVNRASNVIDGITYYNPLSLGVAIETGGHVFHLNFTNSTRINEVDFLANTTSAWAERGYRFGFNISRVFAL